MKKINYLLSFLVLLMVILTNCKEEVAVTGVTLTETFITLTVGETKSLTAIVLPENATRQKVTWKSDDSSVATVTKNGVVEAKSEGTTTIVVYAGNGNYTAQCLVNVEKIKEREPQFFRYYSHGGFSGLNENLTVYSDSTYYSISFTKFEPLEKITYQTQVRTSDQKWENLKTNFNLEIFKKIINGQSWVPLDGHDDYFFYTDVNSTYSICNGKNDENYKKMQDFFDSMYEQVKYFRNLAGY